MQGVNAIIRESGVEAGGAWRFRPQDAAITIRTAAKYPSDGGFHPRRPIAARAWKLRVCLASAGSGVAPWQLALGILPSLAAKAGSIGWASPLAVHSRNK